LVDCKLIILVLRKLNRALKQFDEFFTRWQNNSYKKHLFQHFPVSQGLKSDEIYFSALVIQYVWSEMDDLSFITINTMISLSVPGVVQVMQ
jgi:hypothetical protein